MSERDRLFHPLAGSLIGVLLLCIGSLVASRVLDDSESSGSAAYASAQVSPAIIATCAVYETEQERTTCYREHRDTNAQEGMEAAAWWAVRLSAVALVGLGLTVLFAGLAWRAARDSADADNKALRVARKQIKEARAAADETQRVSRDQSRAYVHAAGATVDYTNRNLFWGSLIEAASPDAPPVFSATLLVDVTNVGETPTKFIEYYAEAAIEDMGVTYYYRPIFPDGYSAISNLAPKDSREELFLAQDFSKTVTTGSFIRPGTPRRGLLGSQIPNRLLIVRGRIKYVDVFDRTYFSDFGFYCFKPTAGQLNPMTSMTGRYPVYTPIDQAPVPMPPERLPPIPGPIAGADED